MTIRAGREWGDTGPVPSGLVRLDGDAALGALIARCRDEGAAVPPVSLRAGDLLRAVGGRPGDDRSSTSSDVARLPCDAMRVTLDGVPVGVAVAHVVVRRRLLGSLALGWWRGRLIGIMNGQYLGDWDVAPRAHPNDGRADLVVVEATMTGRQRWQARRRLGLGTHLPHPSIAVRQVRETGLDLQPGERVSVDGVDVGTGRRLEVVVEPDAVVVHV